MKILVTGAAGFIGMHVSELLLARGDEVVGVDNLNDYYDLQLKTDRLARLSPNPAFRFVRLDVADRSGMSALFEAERFDRVVHLAAQAGVRYSLTNPHAYIDSNLVGFTNMLEGADNVKSTIWSTPPARASMVAIRRCHFPSTIASITLSASTLQPRRPTS